MTHNPDQPPDRPQCSLCGRELVADALREFEEIPCPYCGNLVWFRKQDEPEFVIVNLFPNLDLETANLELVGELLVQHTRAKRVVLNLANVQYVSSTFLGRLLAMQKKLEAGRRSLIVCGANSVVRETFQITKLDGFFTFSDEPAGL